MSLSDELAGALRGYAAASRGSRPVAASAASATAQPAAAARSVAAKAANVAPKFAPRMLVTNGAAATAALSAGGSELIDIGANMLDPMFQGVYRDKQRHEADLPAVLRRARAANVCCLMVTAGSLEEAREALAFCRSDGAGGGVDGAPELVCTVGVHPTRCGEFEAFADGPEAYLAEMLAVGREGRSGAAPLCMAVGECGLDYDRLEFCPRATQLQYFERQLEGLAIPLALPLFLHCRTEEAAKDLLVLLKRYKDRLADPPGVVHSFDGRLEDALAFVALGFCIGLNGCSLRTAENLEVVRRLPAERILLETDAPWCGIKATHAGHQFVKTTWDEVKKPEKWEEGKTIKDRCEPCHLRQVLEVIAGCRGEDPAELAALTTASAVRVFLRQPPGPQ